MNPTDEEVNQLARDTAIGQYGTDDHEEYESTVNGFIMGFNEAISQMQPEWVSVEDRLPEKRQYVVISYWSGYDIAEFKHGLFFVGLNKITDVTHWMPLPQPSTK